MSEYGEEDFSDYGEDWFYVEDEYMPADDLAEHVVNSPPPTAYGDEDALEDWDRFDYFNDLEYASDGYDDGNFYTHKPQAAQAGQKRKRGIASNRGSKKQKLGENRAASRTDSLKPNWPPVVWRSQAARGVEPKVLDDSAEPYALLKDWRERLADTPAWASGSPHIASPKSNSSRPGKSKAAKVSAPISPTVESEEDEEGEGDGDGSIDPAALMAALQKNLAAAGGPLNGMDPQQLLQFAMRMMTNQDAGDDIAGELADDMLNQGEVGDDEDDDGEAPADLLSWLAKNRDPTHVGPSDPDAAPTASLSKSPQAKQSHRRPPTPPSSEATRSYRATDERREQGEARSKNAAAFDQNSSSLKAAPEAFTRKRKADTTVDANTGNASKRRAARSYDAPTTASQAKAAPAKATRSGRAKRS